MKNKKRFWIFGAIVVVVLFAVAFQSNPSSKVSQSSRSVVLPATLVASPASSLVGDIWRICVDALPGIIQQQLTTGSGSRPGGGYMFAICKPLPTSSPKDCDEEQRAVDNLKGNRDSIQKNLNQLNKDLTAAERQLNRLLNRTPVNQVAVQSAQDRIASIQKNITQTQDLLDRVLAELEKAQEALATCLAQEE